MARRPADPQRKPSPAPSDAIATPALAEGELSPLAYMLKILNDPRVSARRRDRMAVTAARYLHSRPGDSGGKKEALLEAAKRAGLDDTEWAGDLDVNDGHRRQ